MRLKPNVIIENLRSGQVIKGHNILTLEGLNFILQTFFGQGITTLYVGLIDLVSYVAVADTDTAAEINGTNDWIENVEYSNTIRQTYFAGTAASQSIDNSAAKASFTMNGTGDLKGAFVCSSNVKSGVAGRLVNAFVFAGGDMAYVPSDVIQVTVIFNAMNCEEE